MKNKKNIKKTMDVENAKAIMSVITVFFCNYAFSKSSVIIRIGNVLIDEKGKNGCAESILLSFLIADSKNSSTLLFKAVSDLKGNRREDLINEIREDCYAFLSVYPEEMHEETDLVLRAIDESPPHQNFSQNVKNKIAELKKTL